MNVARLRLSAQPGRYALALVGLLLAGGLAAYASQDTLVSVLILASGVAALAGFVLWQSPGLILLVLLVNIWLVAGRADPGDLLQNYSFVRWLSYAIIPAFAGLMVVRSAVHGRRWRLTGLEPFLGLLVLLTVISGLVNHTGVTAMVLSLAIYLRYPLLFVVLYNLDLGDRPYLRFVRALVWVAVALLAEGILDHLLLHKQGDQTFFTTGVHSGHVTAGLIFLYTLCIVVAHAFVTRWRWYHLAYLALAAVVGWIAQIRSLFLVAPLLPLGMWAVRQRLVGSRRLPRLALASLAVIMVIVVALGPTLSDESVGFGLVHFIQLRTIGVQDVLSVMVDQNREWLGFGPRSYNPGSLGNAGEMYQLELQRHNQYWVTNFAQGELATGLVELGVIGFSVYWLMLAAILVTALRFWRQNLKLEPQPALRRRWSLIILAFVGIWLHYALLGQPYYDLWRLDVTSMIFWIFAAAIYMHQRAFRLQASPVAP